MSELDRSAVDLEAVAASSDMLDTPEAGRRVVRGGAVRVGGFIAGVGTSVVGAALLTRHLGPADYGRYQTIVALVTIVAAVTDLGMTTLGLREYAQRDGLERDRFMRVLLGMRVGLTALGAALAAAVAVALGYDGTMVAGAGLMGIGVLAGVIAATLGTPLLAEIRTGVVTGLDVTRQVLTAVGIVALVLAGAGIVPFLAVTIPVNLILLALTLPLVRGKIPLRPTFDLRAWARLALPTITFSLAVAVGTMYTYTALVLASLVTTEYETGLFATSFRVFAIVAAVPGILVTTAFPLLSRAARDDRQRLRYASQRLFEGTALLGGAALIGCVVGAPTIITIIAGPQFGGAVDVLRIQGVALAMTFVIATCGFTLLAMHAQRSMIVVNAIALAVSATTVLLLARAHGATGAALGTLLGETTLAVGYILALRRQDRALRPRLGRLSRAAPALAVGLAPVLLSISGAAETVLGLALYGVLLLALGAIPDEVREHLPGPLARFGLRQADRD